VAIHTWRANKTIKLTARDLVTASPKKRMLLAVESIPQRTSSSHSFGEATKMLAAPDAVVVLSENKLFRQSFADLNDEDFPPPFMIQPTQQSKVVPADKEAHLSHRLVGGKEPYTAALMTSLPGLEIDTKTATVTMDGPALAKQAREMLLATHFAHVKSPDPNHIQQVCRETSLPWFDEYTKLTGQKPKGLPVAIPVSLRVVDEMAQTTSISYYVLIEIPANEVLDELKEKALEVAKEKARREKELAEARALREKQMEEARARAEAERARGDGGAAPEEGPADRSLNRRVDELEERIERIEVQLDLIRRLLGEKIQEK
jgi:hypothetical protein